MIKSAECKPTLSAKAFLTTQQRFPGIGNGVLQDILFAAGIHPKRKIGTFSGSDQNHLLSSIISVLRDMTEQGGRDTEKDIFGHQGGSDETVKQYPRFQLSAVRRAARERDLYG